MTEPFIHPLADVHSTCIGRGTRVWQFVIILPDAQIGAECNICSHCFIENDVVVGDRVTIKNGVQLWDRVRIGNDVFIGSNVTFSNDKYPRSKRHDVELLSTRVERGASIGAGATVCPGVVIGSNALVGAGAVVTRNIPPNAIVTGNPARIVGYASTAAAPRRARPSDVSDAHHSIVAGVRLIALPRFDDARGSIAVGELDRSIPFVIKRYFVVFDVPSAETRGEHAHRACHEMLVCVRGSVSVVVDDGNAREEFTLNRPDRGLHVPPMVWATEYKYSRDAALLVLASDYYDADDYIRDYNEFLLSAGNVR